MPPAAAAAAITTSSLPPSTYSTQLIRQQPHLPEKSQSEDHEDPLADFHCSSFSPSKQQRAAGSAGSTASSQFSVFPPLPPINGLRPHQPGYVPVSPMAPMSVCIRSRRSYFNECLLPSFPFRVRRSRSIGPSLTTNSQIRSKIPIMTGGPLHTRYLAPTNTTSIKCYVLLFFSLDVPVFPGCPTWMALPRVVSPTKAKEEAPHLPTRPKGFRQLLRRDQPKGVNNNNTKTTLNV